MDEIRVRYAPSPTGLQHPGGIRTALFCWLFARNGGGKFILRLEDTDKSREVAEATQYLYDSLKWLGIDTDEGPYSGGPYTPYKQSERLHIYTRYAKTLLDKGLAYADPFSQEEVESFRNKAQESKQAFLFRNFRPKTFPLWKPGMPLRFKTDKLVRYEWEDAVRGKLTAGPEALDDFIILKADGFPTYNFANVIDDHEMKITHVLRGEEYIASIPKYLSLYDALGWTPPINATMPLVLGANGGKKLSKRDGSLPILEYKNLGYLADAMNNFLATLGWNDGTTQEVFTKNELIEKFSLKKLQKSPARFELERLNWLNGQHIRKLGVKELSEQMKLFWNKQALDFPPDYRDKVLLLIQDRLKLLSEINDLTWFFFETPDASKVRSLMSTSKSIKSLDKNTINQILRSASEVFSLSNMPFTELENDLRTRVSKLGVSTKEYFMTLRISLTGSEFSPSLLETMEIIGKKSVLNRLENAIKD